jgi:hypothetical protein
MSADKGWLDRLVTKLRKETDRAQRPIQEQALVDGPETEEIEKEKQVQKQADEDLQKTEEIEREKEEQKQQGQ